MVILFICAACHWPSDAIDYDDAGSLTKIKKRKKNNNKNKNNKNKVVSNKKSELKFGPKSSGDEENIKTSTEQQQSNKSKSPKSQKSSKGKSSQSKNSSGSISPKKSLPAVKSDEKQHLDTKTPDKMSTATATSSTPTVSKTSPRIKSKSKKDRRSHH